MAANRASEREITTVQVSRSTHSRLEALKPYDGVTFDALISEMADTYEEHNETR